jgi:hypothetical protein
MIEQGAKVLLGTALYVAVLWEARRSPRAAGMMLTFPALNGITMVMTTPAELEDVAGTMLLLPLLNGGMCGLFLALFNRFVRRHSALRATSPVLWIAISAIWLLAALLLVQMQLAIPDHLQMAYALFVGLGGLALTLTSSAGTPKTRLPSPLESPNRLLVRNRVRIALFAAGLAVVLAAEGLHYSPALLGVLGALPLLPFFSLHTVSVDDELSLAARRKALNTIANGVWLGPAVAVCFIASFWRWLEILAGHLAGAIYLFAGTISLVVGWGLCILAIWLLENFLRRVSQPVS